MPLSGVTKVADSAAEGAQMGMMVLMGLSFVLNVCLSGGGLFFLMLIRSLQIVLHLPLLKVIFPANVIMIFTYIISVAMFDILDSDWTIKLLFTFDEEKQEELESEIPD